jgi:hypothetical protein
MNPGARPLTLAVFGIAGALAGLLAVRDSWRG